MRSFERSIDQWREIERGLKTTLEEIDDERDRFGDVEARLLAAVRGLSQLDLGPPLDVMPPADGTHSIPVPQAEALDVSVRHALGHSAAGHRDVRQRIAEEYERMELSSELLKEMHGKVLGANVPDAGKFRTSRSHFPEFDADGNWIASSLTIPPADVPLYVDHLHERFSALMKSNAVHPLLPIAGFAFDFFRIHPFWDGNGRVTRLALLLLLHKSGYHIGRYISIEGAINVRRVAYLKAIMKTKDGWIAGRHDLRPWCTFVVELIRDAYQELSDRTTALAETARHFGAVAEALAGMPERFPAAELISRIPDVPDTLTRTVLNRMRRQGRLRAALSEMEVEWRKVDPTALNASPRT